MADCSKNEDPLVILDRTREPTTALRGLLAGRPSFLVCGGPSTKSLDLGLLRQRGVFSMGVNAVSGHCQTNAFVCADPPTKFADVIWKDPTIMKFVPTPKMNGRRSRLREKVNGEFRDLKRGRQHLGTCDMPNIWGFGRRSWFRPDDSFFTEPEAAWGNHKDGVQRTGLQKSVCTMLLAIRILYYLGSRKVFLVGVDFSMGTSSEGKGYAFAQGRDKAAADSNNGIYRVVNSWLCEMEKNGVFHKRDLRIYNTNPKSGLRAFPHVPFEQSIKEAREGMPEDISGDYLSGWYEK